MSKTNRFKQFAMSQEVYDAYKAYMLLEDMTFVEFANVIYPIVLEARRAATQKFAGLYGIGGDNNEHVAIYRRVYSMEMNDYEDELESATSPNQNQQLDKPAGGSDDV